MKGDFSRLRFSPNKNYTSVLQQQGRVSLDADANEQCAINDHLRTTETLDVVGPVGGPVHHEGFKIAIVGDTIEIGKGRYYVGGLLCENPHALHYAEQPYLVEPNPSGPELLGLLRDGTIPTLQFYLEVWQRLVTALDDHCLREPALGLADTTARLQTVWRVLAVPVGSYAIAYPNPFEAGEFKTANEAVLSLTQPQAVADTYNTAYNSPSLNTGTENNPIDVWTVGTCCDSMASGPLPMTNPGSMSAQTGSGSGDCSCQPTPAAGYRGLENQLYRVEIHRAGNAAHATFKWSRENASVVVAITGVSGSQVYVDSFGPDANLGFAPGQWVEISDDSNLFGLRPNQPGDLYQIQSVSPETLSVTMTQPVASVDPTKNARMRRWDQFGSAATLNGISLTKGSWLDLENGIQVQFGTGEYVSGDHWLIPARTATGNIEWPPCNSDGAAFQPPHRVQIYVAPLACVQWDSYKRVAHVQDCRKSFYPLTALTPPRAATAMHVSTFSWANDDVTTLDQLIANGIVVTLDQAPTGPINGANFVVTFEPAAPPTSADDKGVYSLTQAPAKDLPSTILRGVTIVDAEIAVSGATLSWELPYLKANNAQRITILFLDELLSFGAPAQWFARARVKLMGRAIFSGGGSSQLFLDGQSFGEAATRADGTTPRIDLQLPSGNHEKASDFEGWFYVAPVLMLVSVVVEYPALTVVVDANNAVTGVQANVSGKTETVTPNATVTVSYPVVADTTVGLSLSGATGVGSVATIPTSVVVKANETTAQFPISILSNPAAGATLTFQITASLNSALGPVPAQGATFTVTAGQVPPPMYP